MINYKKMYVFLSILLIMVQTTACAPEEKKGNVEKSTVNLDTKQDTASGGSIKSMLEDTPSHINKVLSENYIVDADVHIPVVEKADVLYAKYKKFDEQTLVSAFYDKKKPEKETDSEGYTLFKDGNSEVVICDSYIYYSTEDYQYIKYPTDDFGSKNNSDIGEKDFDEVYKKDNLKFMTREKAMQTACDFLKKLSIDNIDHAVENTEIYAIDFETMQKVQEEKKQKDIDLQRQAGISPISDPTMGYKTKNKFTQEDEFYVIFFTIKQNGIPVTQKSYDLNETRSISGSTVEVLLSKKGVIKFACYSIYEVKKIAESPATLLSAEQAIQKAYEIYDSVISTDKVTIKTIDFEYVPVAYNNNYNEVKLTPAWSMVLTCKGESEKEGKSETYEINKILYINAVTGEEIK